jgi:NNP family nitrate/nitrite transporter-like MFS transporter
VQVRAFLNSGHPGTLFSAFLYFGFCFTVWTLNSAMAPFIKETFALTSEQNALMLSIPVWIGALLRLPMGFLSQYIGRKNAAQINLGLVAFGLVFGYWLAGSFGGVLVLGAILSVAGASFGVAMSLGAGWYPPQYKGLAMGIAGAGNCGAVLAVLAAPPLAKIFGWQMVYAFAVAPLLLTMLTVQIFAQEPPDRKQETLREYFKLLVDRDVWVFNLMYMVTFGGYIGLTSFLPTLFHEHYGIAKEHVGWYSAGIILVGSVLRIVGGGIADRIGGLRALWVLSAIIVGTTLAAASMPTNPWMMVAILFVCFSAMGAGNGAVFQLVPLRFKSTTAIAGSLIGEVGALAGGFLPLAMGYSKSMVGSYAPGFLLGTLLSVGALAALALVMRKWTTSWVGEGGKARPIAPTPELSAAQ